MEKFGFDCVHMWINGHDRWEFKFDNEYGTSVIGGPGCYGDGKDTFELAVLYHGKITYNTPITDDVLGYLSAKKVKKELEKIQLLRGDL